MEKENKNNEKKKERNECTIRLRTERKETGGEGLKGEHVMFENKERSER